jgi:hypothetical protein
MRHARSRLSLVEVMALGVMQSDIEPRSVSDLASAARLTRRTLQRRAHAQGTTATACVHLVQCLRILKMAEPWDPTTLMALYCEDSRTIERRLKTAALKRSQRPNLAVFLNAQQLVTSAPVLRSLEQSLTQFMGSAP